MPNQAPNNDTPHGELVGFLKGDLGPARRLLDRIQRGEVTPTRGTIREIINSIERCIARMERDITPAAEKFGGPRKFILGTKNFDVLYFKFNGELMQVRETDSGFDLEQSTKATTDPDYFTQDDADFVLSQL